MTTKTTETKKSPAQELAGEMQPSEDLRGLATHGRGDFEAIPDIRTRLRRAAQCIDAQAGCVEALRRGAAFLEEYRRTGSILYADRHFRAAEDALAKLDAIGGGA